MKSTRSRNRQSPVTIFSVGTETVRIYITTITTTTTASITFSTSSSSRVRSCRLSSNRCLLPASRP